MYISLSEFFGLDLDWFVKLEGMSLCVEYVFIQGNVVGIAKHQVQIL